MQDREAGAQLANGSVAGSAGGRSIGLGAFLVLDTRDEVFYPMQGTLIRLESRLYGRMLGADFGFTQHRLNARRYLRLFGAHVLAVQGVLRLSTGTPPFQMLPGVGEIVRGYPSMRYADRHLLAVQAEYRITPLVWRFGLAIFAGAGQVAPALGDVAWRRFHAAYGAGLRVQIIRSEGINVRWDFGFGPGSSGDYLDLNEAF
jgi:outer membrane protein assembly factor BamA